MMSERVEPRRSVARQLLTGWNPLRLLVCVAIFVLSVGDDTGWRPVASAICVAILASDWIWHAIRKRNILFAGIGVYCALAAIGSFLHHSGHPTGAVLWVIAGLTTAAAAAVLVMAGAAGLRERELDKVIFWNASSLGFFAMMLVGITYGLLDAWLELPALSVWVIVAAGAVAWMAAFIAQHERFS